MEAISGRKTIQEITADHDFHSIQVSQWTKELQRAVDLRHQRLHLRHIALLLSRLGLGRFRNLVATTGQIPFCVPAILA